MSTASKADAIDDVPPTYRCSSLDAARTASSASAQRRSTTLVARRHQRRRPRPATDPSSWAARWADGGGEVDVVDVVGELDRLALDGAVAEHDDDRGQRRRQPHDLHAAHGEGLGPRADDDGGVVRQVGEQVRRAVEHLLEPAMGGPEEVADLARVAGSRRPGRRQVVDEEPVALVGRDAAGRRVRLDEVALLLEHGHLVAHRRRGHLHAGRVGDVGRAHGLRRGDVLLHDGAQDRGLAVVEHAGSQGYRVLTGRGGTAERRRAGRRRRPRR